MQHQALNSILKLVMKKQKVLLPNSTSLAKHSFTLSQSQITEELCAVFWAVFLKTIKIPSKMRFSSPPTPDRSFNLDPTTKSLEKAMSRDSKIPGKIPTTPSHDFDV